MITTMPATAREIKRYHTEMGSEKNRPSSVAGYVCDADSITLYFVSGIVYRYSVRSCGRKHINNMKLLAEAQNGLNSYLVAYKPQFEWKG